MEKNVTPNTPSGPGGAGGPGDAGAAWARVGFAMFTIGFGANLFAPMLQVYREEHASSEASLTAMLGAYTLGLIPALLFCGGLSDRLGRKRVLLPGLVVSIAGSAILALGASGADWPLFLGRVIIGVAVGMSMSSGAAWIKQLSTDNVTSGPRRATVSISAGFGFGPLLSGAIAQFAPAPELLPYLAHIALTLLALLLVWRVPETQFAAEGAPRFPLIPPVVFTRRFFWVIAAWAPWVFGTTTTAFASAPSNVPVDLPWPTAFLGLLACVTMVSGVLIQPLATKISAGGTRPLATVGLVAASLGLSLSIVVVVTGSPLLMLLVGVIMGISYGVMMVGGLIEAEKLAPQGQLGGVVGVYYSLTYIGFLMPFVITLAVNIVATLAGIARPTAFAWVLAFGIVVCLASIRPVARASQGGT